MAPRPNRYYYIRHQPTLLTEELLKTVQHAPDPAAALPQPIRLTKHWLAAFGFLPDATATSWSLEDARLVNGMNCWLCVTTRKYLQFVHELQDHFEEYFHLHLQLLKPNSYLARIA
ncbi:hypothetical protein [Larkinella soli]|uniref:hypothetical protein n=1 Tax=Larkinella soli TaxID=1770527 RepID=UPI000FFC4152|nr:hypothetical protein [Larkinella soli]